MASKLTIQDIADGLGVSKTTVSRAISGKGRISPATTEKVLNYIREQNFTPSAMARGLAQQRTFNIGVVCPIDYELFDLQYFHRCLEGISLATCKAGYDILISMMEGNNITNLERIIDNHKVDGVILTRTLFDDPPARYLKDKGIPIVAIGSSPDKELLQVDNDHFSACRELTSVLIGKGLRRLALIGGDNTHIITDTRRRGFEDAFRTAGLSVDPALIFMGVGSSAQVSDTMTNIMESGADGVICMDEKLTSYALGYCSSHGIRIPDDIALASFYNSPMLENSAPPVTALNVEDKVLGKAAAELLLDEIEGREVTSRMLRSYQIILRESTSR